MTYACGRTFEKAVDDRAAAQGAALLFGLPVQFDIAVGEIEDVVDVVGRQAFDPEQMTVRERGLGSASVHEPRTMRIAPGPASCSTALRLRRRATAVERHLVLSGPCNELPKEKGRPWPPLFSARHSYIGQIFQITPVLGIWTSGPFAGGPTKCVPVPKSRTAP